MKSPICAPETMFLCPGEISTIFLGAHVASSQTKRLPHSFRKSDTYFYPKNVSVCQKVESGETLGPGIPFWAPE